METTTTAIIILFFILSIFIYNKKNKKNESSNFDKRTNPTVQKKPASTVQKPTLPSKPVIKKENEPIYTYVAGIPHKLGKEVDIQSIFKINQTLRSQRDRNNPYDSNAISLHTNSLNIGFIPKAINANIAEHLDSGKSIMVHITSIDKNDLWKGIRIKVELI